MNHMKDVMLEPSLKMVFGGHIPKMERRSKCKDGRCSPSECHLTNTDLVLDPRQAQSIISLLLYELNECICYICIVALSIGVV
jgi:hypothetical protein